MKMVEKLKTCPFCGSEATITHRIDTYGVRCKKCGCEANFFNGEKEVVDFWNNRPIENELSEKIGKLERENHILRLELAEIARGFDVDGWDYTREGMMKIAKEALK